MAGGIYIIENTADGKLYVGSAKDFTKRWKGHLADLCKQHHVNPHLQRAYLKYGHDAFRFFIHEDLGEYDRDVYFKRENEVMTEMRLAGRELYNIARAEGGWSFHDEATKKQIAEKVSASLKIKAAGMTPEERQATWGYWSEDKPYPNEARKVISEKLTGIKRSEETRSRMCAAQIPLADQKRAVMREVGLMNKGRLPANTKQVLLDDGSTFPSLAAAARHLSMSSSGLLKRMRKGELGRYI